MAKPTSTDRATQWLRWIARIWGTMVLGVALLVFGGYAVEWLQTGVADPYAAEEYPFTENLPPLFILFSAIGLGVAWRWEGWGGAIALFFQLAALPLLVIHWPITENPGYIVPYLMSLIVAVPGILFLVCWQRSRKRTASAKEA